MNYTIGICDDCREQVELLAGYLKDCENGDNFYIVRETVPEAFMETLATLKPDLVFLDIDMDGMNGIELGKKIRDLYETVVIVYVTGYEKYAYDAYQLRAFHYLLKPVTKERFAEVLQEALAQHRKNAFEKKERTFSVRTKGETRILYYRDILYFEKISHKIKIHTGSQDIYFYDNLYHLLEKLAADTFVQCHQGYIVNVDKIRAFRSSILYLEGDVRLPVSRTFSRQIQKVLEKHLFSGEETI
ncbi:MAG TPA: LytTR family DNA-binding domain-containing protein [Lachnospiraceae bacterium]|nr:LytTR family DNA-binding domain-containing protein [Lachnospiraceae bacterium]